MDRDRGRGAGVASGHRSWDHGRVRVRRLLWRPPGCHPCVRGAQNSIRRQHSPAAFSLRHVLSDASDPRCCAGGTFRTVNGPLGAAMSCPTGRCSRRTPHLSARRQTRPSSLRSGGCSPLNTTTLDRQADGRLITYRRMSEVWCPLPAMAVDPSCSWPKSPAAEMQGLRGGVTRLEEDRTGVARRDVRARYGLWDRRIRGRGSRASTCHASRRRRRPSRYGWGWIRRAVGSDGRDAETNLGWGAVQQALARRR